MRLLTDMEIMAHADYFVGAPTLEACTCHQALKCSWS